MIEKTDKRHEIMRAAMEIIAEQGFHGAPMSMIAAKAGVGAGTIYRYFESKEVLIKALKDQLELDFHERLIAGYQADKPLRERFIYLLRELLHYFISDPVSFRYLEQFYNSPFGIAVRREKLLQKSDQLNLLQEVFVEGIEQQIMKDLPLSILYALVFGFMTKAIQDHIQGFVVLDKELSGRAIEACWDAIKR